MGKASSKEWCRIYFPACQASDRCLRQQSICFRRLSECKSNRFVFALDNGTRMSLCRWHLNNFIGCFYEL
uniref:Kelch domain-containing protein 10 n=1 Tax=Parascaris univalens TaxID=6257 RepID=A0A915A517_PARUN